MELKGFVIGSCIDQGEISHEFNKVWKLVDSYTVFGYVLVPTDGRETSYRTIRILRMILHRVKIMTYYPGD